MSNSVSHQTPLLRDFPDKNTEMGCHFPFYSIYLTRWSNPRLLHWQMDSLPLSHQGGLYMYQFSSIQSLSCVRLFVTTWTAVHLASLSITNSRNLLKLMSIESVMPSNHLILCRLLLLPSFILIIRVFSNESVLLIRWPKYWSFSFSLSNEYSGLISFRMDWLDLLAVQGILKSLHQQHYTCHLIILIEYWNYTIKHRIFYRFEWETFDKAIPNIKKKKKFRSLEDNQLYKHYIFPQK